MLSQSQRTDIELLIDAHSVAAVLDAIGDICSEKADHLLSNWQDPATARAWTRVAKRVWECAGSVGEKEQL